MEDALNNMSQSDLDALIGVLKDNLSVSLEWTGYHYGVENKLSIEIKFWDVVICTDSVTVEPVEHRGDY